MFDHIGLNVTDLETSVAFYQSALGPLGFALCDKESAYAGFGPSGTSQLWLYGEAKQRSTAIHVAFSAGSREAVNSFYQAALDAGGKDNGKAGVREAYGPTYYAAFVIDPDGNNIEAVCMQ